MNSECSIWRVLIFSVNFAPGYPRRYVATRKHKWSPMAGVPLGHFYAHLRFETAVRHKNRFLLTPKTLEYAKWIAETAKAYSTHEMKKDEVLYRARCHTAMPTDSQVPHLNDYKPKPYPKAEMGAPPSNLATAGRLNPAGIPYLYAATDELTAVAEARPWAGAWLSVAMFAFNRDVILIDARMREEPDESQDKSDPEIDKFWRLWRQLICWTFSLPHHPDDPSAYAPTQFLASAFQHEGVDGIIYSSYLNSGGFNIALFDPEKADAKFVTQKRVEAVNYTIAT